MDDAPAPAFEAERPPYPHAYNDCVLCRETDADFEIVQEALDPPHSSGPEPRRFCQGCLGRWMATMALTRPADISPGAPLAVTVSLLAPDRTAW